LVFFFVWHFVDLFFCLLSQSCFKKGKEIVERKKTRVGIMAFSGGLGVSVEKKKLVIVR